MADEEVTDLTEEGEEGAGGKGAKVKLTKEEKKAAKEEAKRAKEAAKEAKKAAKEAKKSGEGAEDGEEAAEAEGQDKKSGKKEKKTKEPKVKKERGGSDEGEGMSVVILMLLIALVLVSGIVAALYFDIFSARAITADFVRDPLVGFLTWLDPSFNTVSEELREIAQARENAITIREELLYQREEEMSMRQVISQTLEEQLAQREADLDAWEEEIRAAYDRITPLYRKDMTDEELEDMISYSTTFTRMSPADAAEILVRLHNTPEDVAGVLYYMSERQRAPILAAFNPDFAAAVMDVWLYSYGIEIR